VHRPYATRCNVPFIVYKWRTWSGYFWVLNDWWASAAHYKQRETCAHVVSAWCSS